MTDSVVKLLHLSARVLFAVWLFGAIVLLLPSSLAQSFGLIAFRHQQRVWIGPVTLAAFVLWLSYAFVAVPSWIRARWLGRTYRVRILAYLDTLSNEERATLAYFVHGRAPTQTLWVHFPAAMSLRAKRLIEAVPGAGLATAWPHIVPDFVWEEVWKRRDELFGAVDSPEARAFFENFEEFQRERTLYRR